MLKVAVVKPTESLPFIAHILKFSATSCNWCQFNSFIPRNEGKDKPFNAVPHGAPLKR
jgi:hypothetical protein